MESLRKIFALAVVLSVVCSTFARVFVYDEGRAGSQIDQAMLASARASRSWLPQSPLVPRVPLNRRTQDTQNTQDTQDAQGAETGERYRRDHHEGITGPVHTFVKTDKHAHFKWGVRHHVGHEFAG